MKEIDINMSKKHVIGVEQDSKGVFHVNADVEVLEIEVMEALINQVAREIKRHFDDQLKDLADKVNIPDNMPEMLHHLFRRERLWKLTAIGALLGLLICMLRLGGII